MARKLLLISALLVLTASLTVASDPSTLEFNKYSEIRVAEFKPVALDIQTGILYFTVDGTNLYYRPDAESASVRISTLTGLLAELRHARGVVVTYSDQPVKRSPGYPGEQMFPAVAPMKGGALYRPVGGFWLQY